MRCSRGSTTERAWLATALAGCLLLAGWPARAQQGSEAAQRRAASGGAGDAGTRAEAVDPEREARARLLFDEGRRAFYEGRFEEALALFRRAHELSGRDALLYNIGQSLDRMRRDEEAVAVFEEYLRKVPEAPNRGEVEARLQVLRAALQQQAEEQAPPEVDEGERDRTEPAREQAEPRPAPLAPAPTERAGEQEADEGGSSWWLWASLGAAATLLVVVGLAAADASSDELPQIPGVDRNVSSSP